jgi:hypothetical protein
MKTFIDYPSNYNELPFSAQCYVGEQVFKTTGENMEEILSWVSRNEGMGYHDPMERRAAGMGVLLSRAFHYTGTFAFLTAAHWLEDSNWHTEAAILYEMYERDKNSDIERRAIIEHRQQMVELSQAEFEYKEWKANPQ